MVVWRGRVGSCRVVRGLERPGHAPLQVMRHASARESGARGHFKRNYECFYVRNSHAEWKLGIEVLESPLNGTLSRGVASSSHLDTERCFETRNEADRKCRMLKHRCAQNKVKYLSFLCYVYCILHSCLYWICCLDVDGSLSP